MLMRVKLSHKWNREFTKHFIATSYGSNLIISDTRQDAEMGPQCTLVPRHQSPRSRTPLVEAREQPRVGAGGELGGRVGKLHLRSCMERIWWLPWQIGWTSLSVTMVAAAMWQPRWPTGMWSTRWWTKVRRAMSSTWNTQETLWSGGNKK